MENAASRQTASMEDYLEAIAILAEEGYPVKVTEIGKALGVKKPSVTSALTKLSEAGLLKHEKYGDVVLTAEGERIAQDVYWRHRTLRQFLVEILNVDPAVAEGDACRMEHVLSSTSLERLAKFIEFVLNCPRGEPEWLKGFNYYFERGERDEELLARCQREDSGKY
jgi:DtxR family Mn-dependent transcriptional regulator